MGGSVARARAIAALCCCPVETAAGSLWACSSSPTSVKQLHGALRTLVEIVHADVIHRQHHVFQQGQHGQQLEELEDDPQVPAAPE